MVSTPAAANPVLERTATPDRATTVLRVLLVLAVGISLIHYTDNTIRFDDYTRGDPGIVTRPTIPLTWIVLTALGLWGYLRFRRGELRPAAPLLAAYSVSGLISPLHYTTVSWSDFDAFQNTFVIGDGVLGLAVLGFALWLAMGRRSSART
jgi:hypothetical protein